MSAHERALEIGPGLPGIPNIELVEAAIARPYSGYHRTIHQKAAALVDSVARNHGFADGNKRTALILLYTLLARSGYELRPASRRENINRAGENLVLGIVNGTIDIDQAVQWFRERVAKVNDGI